MTTAIKKILHEFIKKNDTWQVQLLQNWPKIMGDMANHAVLLKVLPDTLIIGVSDSCWLQELYLLSPLLLSKINEALDMPHIKKLHFKALGLKTPKKSNQPISLQESLPPSIDLTPNQQKLLSSIKDEQLRIFLYNYLRRSLE